MRLPYVLILLLLSACQPNQETKETSTSQADLVSDVASKSTIAHQAQVKKTINLSDETDFTQANKGLIASADNLLIRNAANDIIWSNPGYKFIKGEAPNTVNPSLWRQEKLNNISGLFKVTDGIYQIRGFDLANMTIIESLNGWIIVDPLTAKESAQAALKFAQQHLGNKPIKAVILTHAHIDHFGGILGVVSEQEIAQQNIRIIAPEGFMDAATSENIIAGIAMSRRSAYMFGKNLPKTVTGHVGSGLGKGPVFGTFDIVQPTELISVDNTKLSIDGIEFVFQNASGSESIAELTFYLPQLKAFGGAELVSRNMHNLYTLRGAEVRNALVWSNTINQALTLFGQADLYFGSHHWPVWGNDQVTTFLKNQRDLYKFIHDQSVRLMNQGFTGNEIAEQIILPTSLGNYFSNRGYYGSLSHNAKAVYQFYMGWFDANPAHLNPLPPQQSATKYVEMMGGSEQILKKSAIFYEQGEYRWLAEMLNHLVFSQPNNAQAKSLLAKTYQQLAFQAESAAWRNFYLTGAQELTQGVSKKGIDLAVMAGIFKNTPVNKFFESMSVRLNSEKAQAEQFNIAIVFTDLDERYILSVNNSVLHHSLDNENRKVDATLSLTHELFVKILIGQAGIKDTLFSDDLSVDGSIWDLVNFFQLFDKPDGQFNIVIP
ncbi:alkyl/aryl-sulfatase [Colwellia sp. 75C3]|uniref:alkyl/aryl-sulfatase n=1 Tax=Colwellia sp. 75C3 TaxID=888425 RepID=UPI000C34E9B8|nr:alkyl sulfatase dimerization domain-containing protein [Colwellia sp. 75C3]PKG82398.1 alkyl/aryl-sulfatase [Colwellia sp. 75C3]